MDPGEILHFLNTEVIPTVRANGWAVFGHTVSGQVGDNVTYTTGLTEAGLAELAIAGLPHDIATVILNDVARSTHLGTEILPGALVHSAAASTLKAVAAPGIVGPVARALYGQRPRFVQLLWPAALGQYPDGWWWPDHPVQPVYSRPLPADRLPAGDGLAGEYDASRRRYDARRHGTDPG